MASSSTFLNRTCMTLPNESNPTEFAKDQRPYKYDELNVAIENPVDLESIRVNGFAEVVHLYKKQGLEYYFDLLNGPTYTEMVKEFWMKASVITRDVYDRKVKEKMKENPEFKERTPEEMGLRSFISTEIESFVAGFRISIRLSHILEALKLKRDGVIIKHSDETGPDVDEYLFKPKTNPKDKFEWTNNCKIIYRILIESILPKLGGTDQISSVQKLFTYNVAKGNIVDIGRLIFDHLCLSIISSKAIVRHSRLLSHMFAQSGLLDAITPYLPGLGTFLLSSKIVNSTTLRYLKLVKNNEIVHPTHPVLLRESEKGIGESWLVHVRDSEAKRVIEAHAEFMKKLGADVGDGEPTKLTVRQSRLLEQPLRLEPVKRKAAKSPTVKKAAKVQKTTKTTTPRSSKPRAKKMILKDLTEEEKEAAVVQAALAKVAEFNRKQDALKDSYDCGIGEAAFDDMHKKLPKRNDPHNLLEQQTLYGNETGKFSNFLGGSKGSSDYFRRLQFPSEIRVKHAFDKILKGVNSEKVIDLSENQLSSKQFKLILYHPSESQANFICNDAAQASTSTAPAIQLSFDDDSDKTPSPPPAQSPNHQEIPTTTPQQDEPQNDPQPNSEIVHHENTQKQPTTPQPENTEPETTQPEHQIPPENTSSEPDHQKSPEPDQDQASETLHADEHVHEKSPQHVAVDNSCDLPTPIKTHVQHINETMNLEILQRTPPDQSQHLQHLLQDLSMDCIFFPPHLPSRIINEPLDQTQNDITSLLQAVDKNLRRMSSAIPHRSIDTAHIDKECDLMEKDLVLMIRSVRKAYTTDLSLRNELARKEEEERRERERLEAEERERKRLEDERIERERQAAEQARLAEEARRAADQARLEQLARNAPEYAQHVLENQENFQRMLDEHSSMLAAIMETLQSINARLPQQPDQP
ncbi:NADH:ubiquinone reductase (H(+)-translocating) [Trifolium repens]|nr:NADH:ubiquinone reductase (H(+)-translocating) [Trifolium repens]